MKVSSTIRISGGEMRGRKIPLPRNHEVRPTSDRARQAFFNIVQETVEGSRFLDLFSGTGIFAFEAFSRGASRVTAVDSSEVAIKQISATATAIGANIEVVCQDALHALARLRPASPYNLVYADPPFGFGSYDKLLTSLGEASCLSPDAIVAIEHAAGKSPFGEGESRLRLRKRFDYGSISISLFDGEAT